MNKALDMQGLARPNLFMPVPAKIVRAVQITETEKHFTLKPEDKSLLNFKPGQILQVSLFGFGEITIGYASSPTRTKTFDIVVRSVGRVSTAINRLEKGETLYLRGPLGKGFDVDKMEGSDILIVAGGIGLCPTRSLIQYIIDQRERFGKFTLFFGAKRPSEQLFLEDLAAWRESDNVDYYETVDDPDADWKGNVGVITTLFEQTEILPATQVVICGPPVMYQFVIKRLQQIGIADDSIYMDLERRMKCGVGICGHCQINDLYCCKDGPVFSYDQIKNLEEALQ